jgi:hypothetical protein
MSDSGEVIMCGPIKVVGITDGATKFDWLKWVGLIKSNVFRDKFRVLRHEPLMEW